MELDFVWDHDSGSNSSSANNLLLILKALGPEDRHLPPILQGQLLVHLLHRFRLPPCFIDLSGIPQIKPTFLGDSSLWVALNYNHESQERQMRPDSLKFPAFIGQPLYCQA